MSETTGTAQAEGQLPDGIANRDGIASYPARKPRLELDFILHSKGIVVDSFDVPAVTWSDHRPLVCDFHVRQ